MYLLVCIVHIRHLMASTFGFIVSIKEAATFKINDNLEV